MAESDQADLFTNLDAFFSAAENADPEALKNAAQGVMQNSGRKTRSATSLPPRPEPVSAPAPPPPPPAASVKTTDMPPEEFTGKFIAIEPGTAGDGRGGEPFILIPAHVHAFLPWWAWLTIGFALLAFAAGIFLLPEVGLSRMTARLGGNDIAGVQSTMRQLVIRGDERTIAHLYAIAASSEYAMEKRLRAVDTLSLIADADAGRMLLRLELAAATDARVRAAAIAARRQRAAVKIGAAR